MKVTILIPTFNQSPAFLRAALMSARHQTHPCEIIVVDDGSTPRQDGVVESVLEGYSAEHDEGAGPRVEAKYVWQENKGVAGALNRALEDATGEWIRWLPSDDLFTLASTEDLVRAAQTHQDFRIVYSGYVEGIPTGSREIPAVTYTSRERLFDMLRQHCFINAATVMWHRDVFEGVGNWNENMVHAQDYEFLLRCAEAYNFLGVSDPLVRRRVHAGQMLNTLTDPAEKLKKQRDMEFIRERYGAAGHVWLPDE